MAKRYSQPQSGAQIDRNNPLSRGLMLAYLPQTNFANLAKQTYPLSSGYAILATGVGRAGVNRLAYPTRAVTWTPPTGLSQATVLVVARNLAESTANIAFDVSSGGGNEFTSYSDNKIYSGGFSGARYVSAFAIPAGTLLSPFVYAVAGVSGNHSTWLNSQKIGSASTAAFSAAASWGIGTQPGGAGTNTEVYLALAWDRALSDAELKSISANPWQLFAPDSSRIWVPVAAGGDSTITQADGTSTAGSLGGSATAATTPTQASGTSTAASIAASATAAAGVTQADGASTAATLVGVASTGSTITQADGSTVASVLAGSATSSAAATQADGVSTVGTLAGSATAASVLSSADGSSSTSTAS